MKFGLNSCCGIQFNMRDDTIFGFEKENVLSVHRPETSNSEILRHLESHFIFRGIRTNHFSHFILHDFISNEGSVVRVAVSEGVDCFELGLFSKRVELGLHLGLELSLHLLVDYRIKKGFFLRGRGISG